MEKTTLSPRERIIKTLNHEPVDRIAVDLGGTVVTGAHVSVVAHLRQALGLDKPGTPVRVSEPAQMLGEVAPDLVEALGVDVVGLPGPGNVFGFRNEGWKPWTTFDGTPVLVPEKFNTEPDAQGNILMYPQGDKTAGPSAKMPKGGFYFDAIIRQDPLDEDKLDPRDNMEEFTLIPDEDLEIWRRNAEALYANTDRAIAAGFPGTGFGDIFLVPAPFMKHPKGIRDLEEWYISTVARKDYIKAVFEHQAEAAVKNLGLLHEAVGDKVNAVFLDGTDLAAQNTLFCSPEGYAELYLPYHRRLNDWIHAHTKWKSMKHCCGGCEVLIEKFIEAGFDILNPVQCSAEGMDPETLAKKYGGRIVFWGGGVDTQQTLPFGTPEEVYAEVKERMEIFGKTPGFVFNPVHNIQCNTPVENVLAMFEALGHLPKK